MPAETFTLNQRSLQRRFAIYVVIAKRNGLAKLYVGKTGDNRAGCNPVISRCGNHFSYNQIHSQIRNYIQDHESWSYTYVFDHFDEYTDDPATQRQSIDRINEMERWMRQEIDAIVNDLDHAEFLNPFRGVGYVSRQEQNRRAAHRTAEATQIINGISAAVRDVLQN